MSCLLQIMTSRQSRHTCQPVPHCLKGPRSEDRHIPDRMEKHHCVLLLGLLSLLLVLPSGAEEEQGDAIQEEIRYHHRAKRDACPFGRNKKGKCKKGPGDSGRGSEKQAVNETSCVEKLWKYTRVQEGKATAIIKQVILIITIIISLSQPPPSSPSPP